MSTAPLTPPLAPWRCADCGKTLPRKSNHAPRGWKRRGDQYYDPECWGGRYVLRALTMSVVKPVDTTWEEFMKALRLMWRQTTMASNYLITRCFESDARRAPGDGSKMPKPPKLYLYPEVRERFPDLPSQSAASLEQAVQAKYRKVRYKVKWTCTQSLPSFRYPTPFPVNRQSWMAEIFEQRPVVSLRLADERYRLMLRGGHGFHRQRAAFDAIVAGTADAGELSLYQRGKKVLVKMVVWLPRKSSSRVASGDLLVRTDSQSLLVCLNSKDDVLWKYHGDHVRRWAAEHRHRLQRWADDTKFEHRPDPPFADRRELATKTYRNRMDSACHTIAAAVEGYAVRRNYARVVYDDSEHGFCPDFQYARLRALLEEKLDMFGIRLVIRAGEESEAQPEEVMAGDD